MKLYAPAYYKSFRCIADKCEHSCCIGWEIDIDQDTLQKYQALTDGYGSVVAKSISMEGDPHFVLSKNDRCPHLDDRGLCKIILHMGEDHLCDICREHPRFYNFTSVAEVGIGMSCPEAARVILASPEYDAFEEIGIHTADECPAEFDGRAVRTKLYTELGNDGTDYPTRLASIYRTYGIALEDDRVWLERIAELEYLNADHKPLFLSYSSKSRPVGKDAYLERALAYFIYRHCTEAEDEDDFAARLGFCLFCERLLASLIQAKGAETLSDVATLASILSEELEYSNDNTLSLTYR